VLILQLKIRKIQACYCVVLAVFLLFPVFLWGQQVKSSASPSQEKFVKGGTVGALSQDYSKEITRKGKTVVVSKMLADKIRADSTIVMSAVTVKASLDKRGKGNGYKIVAVDKGSLAEKMGIHTNDIIQEVNGQKLISSDDINHAEERFKDSTQFKLKIIRKGRTAILYYEIR
jgi:S1-C subfamily serine protease